MPESGGRPASLRQCCRAGETRSRMATEQRGWTRHIDNPKVAFLELELRHAERLVGDLMMDKELLEMCIARQPRVLVLIC